MPAFGFSAGDFVAAIEVLTKAAKSLKEASGATAQYRQATVELNHLVSVLRLVQSLDPSSVSQHITEKVQLCSHACHVPLACFLKKVEKFDVLSTIGGQPHSSPATSLVKGSRKIRWATLVEPQLAKLKMSLAPQLATIEILLQLNAAEQMRDTQKATTKTCEDLESMLVKTDDVKDHLQHRTATRDQLASLQALVEDSSTMQVRHNEALSFTVNATKSTAQQILEKMNTQEAALNALLSKINDELSHPAQPSPNEGKSWSQPAIKTASPDSEFKSTHSPIADKTAVDHTQRLLLEVRDSVAELVIMLLCLLPAMRAFSASFTAMAASPTLLLETNINLEDALGRMLSLPFEHFRYWSVLEARLREAFSGLPGEDKVLRMQYHIVNLQNHGCSVLTKRVWSKAVTPGARLAMSILYRKSGSEGRKCPRCSYDNAATNDAWTKW